MDQKAIERLANTLWDSRVLSRPCEAPIELFPDLSLEDAYHVSLTNFERRCKDPNVRSIGRKIGLTSLAVQKQLGVHEPDYGYLTSDMRVPNGGMLKPQSLIQGRVEGEVAFVLKKNLAGPGVTPSDVIAATDHVVACIEIIDSRVRDWKIKIQDTVADNASSAMIVLGEKRKKLEEIDLRMAGMTLRKNGEIESVGVGAACLNHPVNAVTWLANKFGSLGDRLKAGDIILSGAYGPVVPFSEGDSCEIEISGLGKVFCSYGRK